MKGNMIEKLLKSAANAESGGAISIFGSATRFALCIGVANTIYARVRFGLALVVFEGHNIE